MGMKYKYLGPLPKKANGRPDYSEISDQVAVVVRNKIFLYKVFDDDNEVEDGYFEDYKEAFDWYQASKKTASQQHQQQAKK